MSSKKPLVLFVALIITGSLLSLVVNAEGSETTRGSFGGGSGTAGDPYVIEDVWDLQNMSKDLSAHYVLGNDINASDTVNWNSGAGFDPVGTDAHRFNGRLEGKGHTITALFINRSAYNHVGLFGYIYHGQVKNVSLIDIHINGKYYVGGLVGYFLGNMSDCHTTGYVDGINDIIGGLVGRNYGTVTNCSSTVEVRGNSSIGGLIGSNMEGVVNNSHSTGNTIGYHYVGGLVGSSRGIVTNCSSDVQVSGDSNIGGLIGINDRGVANNCHATGNTSGRYGVGGLIGYNSEGIVNNCYVTGNVRGNSIIGGLAGINQGEVSNCYALCNVSGVRWVGGLVGFNDRGMVSNSHYNIENILINEGKHITLGCLFDDQYQDWISNKLNLNIADYSGTLVPSGGYYNIYTAQGIRDMLGFADAEGLRFRLMSDIDLSDHPGLYLPYFGSSEFEGNNKTFSNLYLDINFSKNLGMFGYLRGGTIKNLGIIGINIYGSTAAGGLAGYSMFSTMEKCYTTGVVNGWDDVGGLVGYSEIDTVEECYSTCVVSGYNSVGGLVGDHWEGTVTNCYATGSVSGFNNHIGGLIGLSFDSIVSICYSSGKVIGYQYVGGLIGLPVFGILSQSFWDMQTSGLDVGISFGNSSGVFGKQTSEMKNRSTFTYEGWDFDNIWYVIENVTYPFFQWQDSEPPKAFAGPDMLVDEGTLVTFDGSMSSDDVGIVNYTWIMEYPTYWVRMYGVNPTHYFAIPGEYTVTLQITDYFEKTDTDNMTVTVRDITIPLADAGLDLTVDEGTVVTFEGSNSTDNLGIVNYTWSFIDGDPIVLYGIDPSYQFKTPGVYIVTLNVSDAAGLWATDTMTVTVRDITAPIAVAGPDLIVDEGSPVTFDGGGSSDNVGIVNYTWTFVDGEIIMLTGMDPSYRFDTPGVYTVVLNVTDASGHWGVDSMIVTVLDITAPKAVAGLNRTVDEGTTVTFDGSGSYDNVGIANYTWTFIDGDPIVLYGIDPSYRFDTPGVYIVTLNVSDAAGLWAIDSLTVTIRDITPPVADAGEDQAIEEEDTVQFDGSGSNDNVGIVNYTWSFYDGSSSVMLYGISPSHTFSISGIYVVTLTVKDEAGNEGSDTMKVEAKEKEGNGIVDDPIDPLLIIGSIILLAGIIILVFFLFLRGRNRSPDEGSRWLEE